MRSGQLDGCWKAWLGAAPLHGRIVEDAEGEEWRAGGFTACTAVAEGYGDGEDSAGVGDGAAGTAAAEDSG